MGHCKPTLVCDEVYFQCFGMIDLLKPRGQKDMFQTSEKAIRSIG